MRLDSYSCLANSSTTKLKVCQMTIRTRVRSSAASQIDWGRSIIHSPERVWAAKTQRMASTLMAAICLAVGGQVQAQTVMGTLACDASLVQPPEPAFSVPANVRIDGSALTWTREATGMREVVSAPVVNGVAVLDGYGGSVSANTRQAFWDWRIQARLNVSPEGVAGEVHLLTKDGRTVQRRCTFTTAGRAATLPAAATQAAPAPASIAVPVPAPPSPVAAPPATPVQVSPAPAQPPVIPDAGGAAREEELRAREAALARREQSVSRRERALTQAPKPVAPPPAPKAAQPAAPPPAAVAAPAAPAKPSSPAALGDI